MKGMNRNRQLQSIALETRKAARLSGGLALRLGLTAGRLGLAAALAGYYRSLTDRRVGGVWT
jgi:hypothetical protein